MVFILGIAFAFFWFKEVISSYKFENCAGQTPHISRLIILTAETYLWRTVLSRLNNIRELIINVTSVSHVNKLNSELQGYYTLQIVFVEGLYSFIAFLIWPQTPLRSHTKIVTLLSTLWLMLRMSKNLGTFIIIQKTTIFLFTLGINTVEAGSSSIVIFRKINLLSLFSQPVSPMFDYLISFWLWYTSWFLFLFTIGISTVFWIIIFLWCSSSSWLCSLLLFLFAILLLLILLLLFVQDYLFLSFIQVN